MKAAVCLVALCLLVGCSPSGQADQTWQMQDRLQAIDGPVWVVGDHLARLSPLANVDGTPEVGAIVQVSGRQSMRRELLIDSVEVVQGAAPTVAPTAVAPPARITSRPAATQPARVPAQQVPAREKKRGHGDD